MADVCACCRDIREAVRRFGSTNRRICWFESMLCFLVLLIWHRHPKSWPSCSVNPSFWSHMLSDKQPLQETLWLDRVYWSLSTVIPADIWNLGCKQPAKKGIGVLIPHCSHGISISLEKADIWVRWNMTKKERKLQYHMAVLARLHTSSDFCWLCNMTSFAVLLLPNTPSLLLVAIIP